MFIPAPGELLLIGLLIALLISGKYFYNKLQYGRYVYWKTRQNNDDK